MRNVFFGALMAVVVAQATSTAGALAASEIQAAAVQAPPSPPIGLEGGAESIEALLDRLLEALEKEDKAALRRLSVTEDEYRRIIVPGRVEKGAPRLRNPAQRNVDYFWSTMAFKSELYADKLVENFGGRTYVDRKLELTKPSNEWAWYRAHGEVRLMLVPAEGDDKYLLQAGWIVEVDGVYKFLSYEYDG
jgi:hypothetical protein